MISHEATNRICRYLRWTARILSLLYLAFFLFMLTAHLVSDGMGSSAFTVPERLGFLFIGVLFVGYLMAWKWETLGGAIGVLATIGFHLAVGGGVILLLIMAFPGVLFLLCWPLSRGGSDSEG
ncbi:MAG: DUF7670 domain-containing protein [Planctomycetota bacterium]|jgi:hypothetical protein